jgi:hypothetical protein
MARPRVPGATADQLRDLLRRQVQAASDETIHSGGQVSADQVEALSRLARLVEIHEAAQPARRRKRWPAALLFGGALLVVSILLFARVRETEIELDLAVSEVSFVSPTQQTLTETMDLTALGVSGLREMQLPGDRAAGEEAPGAAEEGDAGLRLSVVPAAERPGSINLATVTLAAGDHVWLRRTGPPYQCRLSLKGKPTEHRANVLGVVQAEILGAGTQRLDFVAPQSILLRSGAEDTDFDLAFVTPAGNKFAPQLEARDLSLFTIDESLDPGRTVVRRLSTIESGSLYFVSLGDQERKLRPGEMIAFETSQGEIRTIRLQDDHIELEYHGCVRGLSTGVDESRRSLMPTWFEWLSARHSLSLLWGTAIFLYGLATAAMRWFGRELS